MELLQTFKYGSLKVEIYYNGTSKLPNKTYLNDILIYEDDTFRPSPLYNIDDSEVMAALLWFLTLTEDDVEEDYFEERNCLKLLDWAQNSDEAEDIKCMVNDYEMKDDEDFLIENELTIEEVKRLENYLTIH